MGRRSRRALETRKAAWPRIARRFSIFHPDKGDESALSDDRTWLLGFLGGAAAGNAGEREDGRERDLLPLEAPLTNRHEANITPEKLTKSIDATGRAWALCLFHVSATTMTQRGAQLLSAGPETAMLTA
ncbi:hypothetical protein [Bosea sp. FBZP-16]|uniref:hypothetical protein n=1 Tax=Bosea sp. FBZP-16 TaxID=2065382 RepID=UPI001319F4EE|nr:hypothetical protein [Bosea sp. FBZP-16]